MAPNVKVPVSWQKSPPAPLPSTLKDMDSVRLGRVLGRGARGAARTLISAVDAATAPAANPVHHSSPPTSAPQTPRPPAEPTAARTSPDTPRTAPTVIPPARAAVSPAAARSGSTPGQPQPASSSRPSTQTRPAQHPRPSPAAIAAGTRRFGQATWSPIARLSGVLWLEFTGVFFGIFALSAATGAWRLRTAFERTPPGDPARAHLVLLLAVALLFTWFCASSFVRARRRGRRA